MCQSLQGTRSRSVMGGRQCMSNSQLNKLSLSQSTNTFAKVFKEDAKHRFSRTTMTFILLSTLSLMGGPLHPPGFVGRCMARFCYEKAMGVPPSSCSGRPVRPLNWKFSGQGFGLGFSGMAGRDTGLHIWTHLQFPQVLNPEHQHTSVCCPTTRDSLSAVRLPAHA